MNTQSPIIEVATGEVKVAQAPAFLQCLALGSCVAVILYDEEKKVGGIAHVMLPSPIQEEVKSEDSLKYAGRAVRELVKQLCELGAGEERLAARLVGGARVIPDAPDVGKENVAVIRNTLREMGIRVADEHLGGAVGRSVLFNVATGELQINGKSIPLEMGKSAVAEKEKKAAETPSEYTIKLEEKVAERTKELNERVAELDNVRKAIFNLLEDLEKERESLTEAKAKNEAMLGSLGDGIAIADEKGKLIYFNKFGADILGADANQGLPDTWQKEYGIFDPATLKPYPAD